MKVFVYGTLKKGYGNNVLLQGANLLGKAKTKRSVFCLHDNGFYPYAIEGTHVVKGELYEINKDHLEQLDCLEGYPTHYDRRFETIVCEGHDYGAHMYIGLGEDQIKDLPIVTVDNNTQEWVG